MLFAVPYPPHKWFRKVDDRTHVTPDAPDFSLSLTTESVWRNDIAGMVTAMLRDRFALSDSVKTDIETCLHEALINAVVHGNLSLRGKIEALEDFELHYTTIKERIGRTPYKNRRINIAIWDLHQYLEINVSDEGKGFTADINFTEHTFPYGRGLFIIHSLADSISITEDRRTLCMRFKR